MTTLYDAPADEVIEALTETFADEEALEEPEWMQYVKSGADRELPPQQEKFWNRRAASLLRKVAIDGPVGVGSLKTAYGSGKQGSNRYQVRPRHSAQGAGKIVRTALQQLEAAGYVETAEGEGRQVTPEGKSLLDQTAKDVIESLDDPALEKYV